MYGTVTILPIYNMSRYSANTWQAGSSAKILGIYAPTSISIFPTLEIFIAVSVQQCTGLICGM